MPPNREAAVGYRRNGKKQACEPCRKGKLACDHGAPFCGRCVRRKTTARCFYHPAPMTKSRDSEPLPSPRQTPSVASSNNTQRQSPQTAGAPERCPTQAAIPRNPTAPNAQVSASTGCTIQGCSTKTSVTSPEHVGQPKEGWKEAVFPRSAKYYGLTSFSAIFSEHQAKFHGELLDIGEDKRKHPGNWVYGQPLLGRERPNGPTARETRTIKALFNIPAKEICEVLLKPVAKLRDITLDTRVIGYCNSAIWSNFAESLSQPRSAESLTIFSDVLFKNEETPLPASPDDPIEWLNTFTGPNLRFEMLGLMFCFYGMGYLALQDWDPLFEVPENFGRDRKQTAWRMKECADVCLDMCDCSDTVNYLVAALILNLKRLETACTGDETYHMRRLHGDLVTTTITSGLHRLSEYGANRMTAASEYKRRLFCAIYCNDKTNASMNGVPPLLTRRFCDVQPCLDLPDEALLLPPDELALAASQLDPNGWNTSGSTYQLTTLLRARLQISIFREEILELALGINVEVSGIRIENMHQRCKEVYNTLPHQLHYYDEAGVPKALTGTDLYDRANLLLQFLQNKFLIDRIALARGLDNGQSLLNTAIESIDIVLLFWSKRDHLMSFSCNFDWIVTFYGIPPAGVICVELLKMTAGQSSVQFSRPDAIQKLTLFIAFLEWIRPTDGNYALAQRLRKVIQRVLNYVLDSRNETTRTPNTEIPFDPMMTSFTEMDDLDWLNTIDWTQGSWMDFNSSLQV
ncbi:uncharacterized protein PAC_03064 [Phialocephala subalpina]|uniref:Zn(2)-C6 fungal-type domain-containing protein n=1 Tax=Phialocephala subalpina TaxID=576137 RepID=A0A1L7WKA0_9HELO|nr:uncharacterized protein PAC_03064 [Phialocephala subalpina]